jgi:FkbM family methyltransferase
VARAGVDAVQTTFMTTDAQSHSVMGRTGSLGGSSRFLRILKLYLRDFSERARLATALSTSDNSATFFAARDSLLFNRSVFSSLVYWRIPGPWWADPEMQVLEGLVRKGSVVIDVGANVGIYSLLLSRLAGPSGQVLAYEPYHWSAERLREMIRILGIRNITVSEAALSDHRARVELSLPRTKFGTIDDALVHVDASHATGSGHVDARLLDDEIERLGVKQVAFLKVDVEGFEFPVMSGARRLLVRDKPVILCELEPQWCERYGFLPSDTSNLLRDLVGYLPFVLRKGRFVPSIDLKERCSNFFFFPPGHKDTFR